MKTPLQAQAWDDFVYIAPIVKAIEKGTSKMKVEVKTTAKIEYIEELSKYFDLVVEDGRIFITSIYRKENKPC